MPTPYSASMERNTSADELRARIPGWGVDLDPADRPSSPREDLGIDLSLGGARPSTDGIPERQEERWPRERSIEHEMLTPVFGTSTPPKALSGRVRKFAYARYSEGRAAHWLLLLAADRVDAWEAHLRPFASTHPDNPVTESGVRAELRANGWKSRVGRGRTDLVHQPLDILIVFGPWLLGGGLVIKALRKATTLRRS